MRCRGKQRRVSILTARAGDRWQSRDPHLQPQRIYRCCCYAPQNARDGFAHHEGRWGPARCMMHPLPTPSQSASDTVNQCRESVAAKGGRQSCISAGANLMGPLSVLSPTKSWLPASMGGPVPQKRKRPQLKAWVRFAWRPSKSLTPRTWLPAQLESSSARWPSRESASAFGCTRDPGARSSQKSSHYDH